MLSTPLEQACPSPKQHVPQPAPVLFVVVDQQNRIRVGPEIAHSGQLRRLHRLRLGVDGLVKRVAQQCKAHRNQSGLHAVRGSEVADSRRRYPPSHGKGDEADHDIIG